MSISNIGLRIVDPDNPVTIFKRFPESDDRKTLSPGQASPVITSFLPNGYYQVDLNGVNGYIKAKNTFDFVDRSEEGSSSLFSDIGYTLGDIFGNLSRDASANVGYLKEGIEETKKRTFFEMFEFAGLGTVEGFKKFILYSGIGFVSIVILIIILKFGD